MINHHDAYLTPIACVDYARRIDQRNSVFQGQSAAGHHICHVPIGQGDGNPGIDKCPLAGRQDMGRRGLEVSTCVARVGILRRSSNDKNID
jgi:hypothetical protein